MADEFLSEIARLPRNIQGSFTCRKSTTWDQRIYFPSEGREVNPRTWVPKASTLPLDYRSRYESVVQSYLYLYFKKLDMYLFLVCEMPLEESAVVVLLLQNFCVVQRRLLVKNI